MFDGEVFREKEDMNIILVSEHEVSEGKVHLEDHRAKHIAKILRSEVGDTIKIGIINGKIGTGKVLGVTRKFPFVVELTGEFDTVPPPKNPVDLLLALPRPIMLRRIFSQIASLGVETLHIVNAGRVEKSFWEAGLVEPQEYMQHLLHGLEQSVDTVPPKIFFHRCFKPFIEESFPLISNEYKYLLYAHPGGRRRLGQVLGPDSGKILLAIGPEGGWVDYETAKFEEYGFAGFSIGPRILKVDTAVVNIHGRVMAEIERCL
jgi:RsmE family RNA methyltransferase